MTARAVHPLDHPPDAVIRIPGSKSITNRALVAALLATGRSTLSGVLFADDTEAMLEAIAALGAVTHIDREARTVRVDGVAGSISPGPLRIDARQSGTTARFLAAVVALGDGEYRLDADEQMLARPMGDLVNALAEIGVRSEALATPGHLPLAIFGRVPNSAANSEAELPGHVSSQFASALLLAAPCMAGGLTLRLSTPPVSLPYLDMTVAVMRSFGADVRRDGDLFSVAPGGYRAADYVIEPDASAASYFFAAAAMTGGRVTVPGLGTDSMQGDMAFVECLAAMGAVVDVGPVETTVTGTGTLRGIEANLRDYSDTQPTLAVVAAIAEGETTIDGIGFIRHKESDRIGAVVTELRRLGVGADELDDGLVIRPAPITGGAVETYDDHRIAMAFSLLGLVRPGISIKDPECVHKTFPEYFDTLDQLRFQGPKRSQPPGDEADPMLVVAIDGPAGSGKSTVAKAVAEALAIPYLDTGAMYRSIAFACIRRGIDPFDEPAVARVARDAEIVVDDDAVRVDGIDATTEIRGPEVTRAVSTVAANQDVREHLVSRQREWAHRKGGGVMEGRDIGTVVFPDATLKVFLTASVAVRAQRRAQEVTDLDYETVAADIARRDAMDENRDHSPLLQADDAIVVDTSDLTIDEVVAKVVSLLP